MTENFNKRKKTFTLLLATLLLTAFFYSCKNTKDDFVLDYHYNYYPIDSGHYVVYDVDSIHYASSGQVTYRDSARYQLREMITDTFYDLENQLCYKVELSRRANSSSPWTFDRVWHVKATKANIQKTEGDVRFVKLIFPPKENAEWNGNIYVPTTNQYSVFQDWEYYYKDVHQPYSINGFNFDSTVTVSEVDEENVIEKKLRKEVYAKGVGMIYQEWEVGAKQNVQAKWDTGIQNGFRIRMRVAEHN
ncbi:MAG: hypothetical protein KIS94_14495 [Chitinophagales bacterium]|nr:hypothetical protein [Chitinophagales bacterium]